MAMASRAANYMRSLASTRRFATSTVDDIAGHRLTSAEPRGDYVAEYVPIYASLGLILLAASLGLHAAKQQLAYSPNVLVSKKKRETVPEVVDPDWAVRESELFINKSIFRKIAHLQDFDAVRAGVSDPTRAPASGRLPLKAETLKSVGVELPRV
ncbi:uncharacterized protein [Typha latifolia]|uniref:uncharacterized protein isoform X2 n=1 Tax=Typha latifolia TaxID=4733 RepID=UPI003C2B476D